MKTHLEKIWPGGGEIDRHLSNVAINYHPSGFIADRIFPTTQVSTRSAPTLKFKPKYFCKPYALKADVIQREDQSNSDPISIRQYEEGRVMRLMDALFLDWEIRMADKIAKAKSAIRVFKAWIDYEASNPLHDVYAAIDNVEVATGIRPNRILFSGTAWRNFRRCKIVIEEVENKFPYTREGIYPSTNEVETLLGMEVLVGNAWTNTAKEGHGLHLTQVWEDHVYVYYTPNMPEPELELPSFGYNLRWCDQSVLNMQVLRYPYNARRHCQDIEVGYFQDEVVVDKFLGVRISHVTSNGESK